MVKQSTVCSSSTVITNSLNFMFRNFHDGRKCKQLRRVQFRVSYHTTHNKQAEDPDTFKGHQTEKNSDMYLVHTLNTKVGFTSTEDKILMNVNTKENSGKCQIAKNKNQ